MRILHTSDWHLGSTLDGISRDADHAAFLKWLADAIAREEVDVLVIAGDVFDLAHPSAEAQRMYFQFLRAITQSRLKKVVIVGGNHDSPSRLDAPREVLQALEVHVVGGLGADPKAWERCLCPIPGAKGGVDAVVLAVPFLHEYRLGVRTALESPEKIREDFEQKLRELYARGVDLARARHDGAPVIATGHLTCLGWEKGDSPADIHMVGSIGGLHPAIFDPRLQYVALGHIHRSYQVGTSRAYYSGTPVALGLQETVSPRKVRIVDLNSQVDGAATVRSLEVPSFRPLLELKGSLEEVAAGLRALAWEGELPPIVYAKVLVDRFTVSVEETLRKAALAHGADGPHLAQVRQSLPQPPTPATPAAPAKGLGDLSPEEVFVRLCEERGSPADAQLLDAFRSLLSPAQHDEVAR